MYYPHGKVTQYSYQLLKNVYFSLNSDQEFNFSSLIFVINYLLY